MTVRSFIRIVERR